MEKAGAKNRDFIAGYVVHLHKVMTMIHETKVVILKFENYKR